MELFFIISICLIVVIVIAIFIINLIYKNKQNQSHQDFEYIPNNNEIQSQNIENETTAIKYEIKSKYLSYYELKYYEAIQNILEGKYILFPQVPLSQIIVVKNKKSKYQSELYRVIDFCIFDKDYTPLLCIEINDETHHQRNRYIRDKKVQNILNNAGLPLITLWTNFELNINYIENRIKQHIEI